MPMMVTKTFLVDTDDVDEAHELTKIDNDKVGTLAVNGIRPYDPNTAPKGAAAKPTNPHAPVAQPQQTR